MLTISDFKISQMKHNGFGGKILLLSSSDNKYVLKVGSQAQSINEYVAQHILKSLGFTAVSADLIEYNEKCYGVTEYQEGIKAFSPFNLAGVSDKQKIEAVELFLLNAVLNNVDMGEYYLKDDKIITLDYGESIISPLWVNAAIVGMNKMVWYSSNISEFISNAMSVLSKHYEQKICQTALENLIKRFENQNAAAMEACYINLDESFYDGFALMYCNYIGMVKNEIQHFIVVCPN